MENLTRIAKKIASLEHETEKLRRIERDALIRDLNQKIRIFAVTSSELDFGNSAKPGERRVSKRSSKKPGLTKNTVRKVAPKYRDLEGNHWTGRGKKPLWLQRALLAGASLDDYLIKD